MTKTLIKLQDLRRRIYLKAKAQPAWRFWGIYTHVCKRETLEQAYQQCKRNRGIAGLDNVTFEMIEAHGVSKFLESIRKELVEQTYKPQRNLLKRIPKGNGKYRTLSIPAIRDRVVQGAVKLILEPIFEADFQEGSYGGRPRRCAHDAIDNVAKGIVKGHTRVIDIDLKAYYDNMRHHIILNKLGQRIDDNKMMRLVKIIIKAEGKKGVAQGGPLSPLLANVYLNDIDKMLEKAMKVTSINGYKYLTYTRYMDDIVICIDKFRRWEWLYKGVRKRVKEELIKIEIPMNEEKTKEIDTEKGETFTFLGFEFQSGKTRKRKRRVIYRPTGKARNTIVAKIRNVVRKNISQPVMNVVQSINPIIRGWVNYFRIGAASKTFKYVKYWVMKKIRRHLMRQRGKKGFGWSRWSNGWIYTKLGLFSTYKIVRYNYP